MPSNRYYCEDASGQIRGPYLIDQMRRFWRTGQLTAATQVCRCGDEDWMEAAEFSEIGSEAPASAPVTGTTSMPVSWQAASSYAAVLKRAPGLNVAPPKARWLYVVLAIFFGGLGIHNLYAGRTTAGVTALTTVLMTRLMGGSIFLPILGLLIVVSVIEMFTVSTDGRGRAMV